MNQNKVYSLLGIAMKGRRLVSGEFQTLDAVRKGSAALVIIAEDASDNTKKKFADKCRYYDVPVCLWGNRESLGRAIGKEVRSSVGICDQGLARSLTGLMAEQQKEWKGTVDGKDGGKHGED